MLTRVARELLASYNLYPKKRLGQHFLVDQGVLARLVSACHLKKEDRVLEVGTGLGVLTAELAQTASAVISVEKDRDLVQIAKEALKRFNNVKIESADILDYELIEKCNKAVGNLPYYITTPIIEKLLEVPVPFDLIVLTIQREVAERLAAAPGGKTFGAFTVFVQNRAEVKLETYVPKTAFYPQPEVGSAVISLKPYLRPKYHINSQIVRSAFGQRRKMLRSALKELAIDFAAAGIDPRRRAETLSLEEFERLSYNLKA